jgi:hypothetical protein
MSVRNAFALLLALCAITFLVACGGSSPKVVPPPSGGFSDSNLSGTYVFSSSGVDTTGAFLAMVGTLAANGSGTVSSGTVDITGLNVSAAAQSLSGSYKITADGRGQIKFGVTVTVENSAGTGTTTKSVTFVLDCVLTSNSHGLVTEFDGNGTGSGTIDLQSAVSQAQLAGSYAFGVSGVGDSSTPAPFAAAGTLTLDSTGAVTAGEEDINNAGAYVGAPSSITPGATSIVTVGATPGAASLAVAGVDTFTFDVFPIDSTHLKLIETDGILLTSGDVYTQGTSIPTGQLVFTMAGENITAGTPLDSGGWLTNNSGTISAGLEDFNDGGNVNTATAVGGSIAPVTGGRSVFTLTGFVNGAASDVAGTYAFAAYPFTAGGANGVQLLEIDNGGITSGTAYAQTATSLASQGFGLNLTGFNSVEEDDIAEFTTSSTGFSGIVDLNDDGTTTFDKGISTSGFTPPDSNGRGQAVTNFFSFNFYTVNSSTVLLLEIDTTQVGLGAFELQSGSGATGAAQSPAALFHPVVHAHAARSKPK